MFNGVMPAFDLAEGGFPLIVARSIAVMALFSAFGTLLFHAVVAPKAFERMAPEQVLRVDRRFRRLVQVSLTVSAIFLMVWLVGEAEVLADGTGLRDALAAAGPVLLDTEFGHLILMQLAAIAAVALVLRRSADKRQRVAAAFMAALATLLQAGHGHALAMEQGVSLLLVSDGVHLLSAGGWLGGLLPLLLVVQEGPPKAGAAAARHFSPLGKLCLSGLVVSAAYQGWELLGGVPGLVGTIYGRTATVKAALFVVLVGFAWFNRYRFAPALLSEEGIIAKRSLVRSIAVQIVFGLAVIVAAAILSNLPPGAHTQPVWPFSKQPSLITIQEDPDLRREALGAVLGLGVSALILALGVAIRRIRWPAVVLSGIIIWLSFPHLDLFFVEAYPTSFYRSPTNFASTAIASGAALFPKYCAACHGGDGRGDGPGAKGLPEPPADLTAPHLWGHPDGELFWWLSHGIAAPSGRLAMPGFADSLDDEQRWDLIDYIRANNAGLVHAATGIWAPPVRAPELTASCLGGGHITLADLRGRVLRIVFSGISADPPILPSSAPKIVTITVPAEGRPIAPSSDTCVASDPAIRTAYGTSSGIAPELLFGVQFLIDSNGWLRFMDHLEPDSVDSSAMLSKIAEAYQHPFEHRQEVQGHHH